jgi:N-acetylneuraminic acid mutarotase
MSAAQKKARENFKKAIAYRKKTGCSLKQAFTYVKGGKVTGVKKAVKKVVRKKAVKKVASKKPVSSHKDTKSHNVNIRVVSGVNNHLINKYKEIINEIENYQDAVKRIKKGMSEMSLPEKLRAKEVLQKYAEIIRSLKKHKTNFKKNI